MQFSIAVNVTATDAATDEASAPVRVVRQRNSGGVVRATSRRYALNLAATITRSDVREHAIEFIELGTPHQIRSFISRMTAPAVAR